MKKTLFMLFAASLMMVAPSCKKGANDPAMSLSSRKARVANSWTMSGYESYSKNTQSDGDWSSTTESYDASTGVITVTDSSFDAASSTTVVTTSTTTVNDASATFEKDGTFTRTMNTTTVTVSSVDILGVTVTTTTTDVSTLTESGNWSFLGKVKDEYKNKERLITNAKMRESSYMSTTVTTYSDGSASTTTGGDLNESTVNYHSGEVQTTYEIDRLKGKEMVLKMYSNQTGESKWTPSGGGSQVITPFDVYTMSETITMTEAGS